MDGDAGYALQKLELAILDMATGAGDVRSRLYFAFQEHLHVLQEKDFPDNLRSDWKWIMKKLTRVGPTLNNDGKVMTGSVPLTLKRMRNSTGTEIAERIVTLSALLRGHLEDIANAP